MSAVAVTLTFLRRGFHGSVHFFLSGFEVLGELVLPRILFRHTLLERHDRLSSRLHRDHRVKDGLVGDVVTAGEDLSVLTGFYAVDVLLGPETDGHHRCAYVDQQ